MISFPTLTGNLSLMSGKYEENIPTEAIQRSLMTKMLVGQSLLCGLDIYVYVVSGIQLFIEHERLLVIIVLY